MHGEDCGCTRCVGFRPGNELSVRHGAKAVVHLTPRAEQIEAVLVDDVPVRSPSDSAAISVLAMVLAQLERASAVLSARQAAEMEAARRGQPLDPEKRDDLKRLSADARGWANTAGRYFDQLGLTPTARARLGLDIARTQHTLTVLDLHALAEREDDAT